MALDRYEYLEYTLWGDVAWVIVTLCDNCGWTERTDPNLIPAAG